MSTAGALPTETGNPRRDRAALEVFVARFPERPLAWRRLGEHELRRGRERQAVVALERAAREYRRRGLTLRAVDCLKRLVRAVPDHAAGFVALGACIAALDLHAEARCCFLRAAELHLSAGERDAAVDVLCDGLARWPEDRRLAALLAGARSTADARNSNRGAAVIETVR